VTRERIFRSVDLHREIDVAERPEVAPLFVDLSGVASPDAQRAAQHVAEGQVAGVQAAEPVAFADIFDFNNRFHRSALSDQVCESLFDAAEEVEGERE
jgi:hypothetical protein